MDNNMDKNNLEAYAGHLKRNVLLYPDERIVTFLAANYPDSAANSGKKALDIGFGSGRHLGLLLNYGFQAYGIDYNSEAIDVAKSILGEQPLLKELKVADIKD